MSQWSNISDVEDEFAVRVAANEFTPLSLYGPEVKPCIVVGYVLERRLSERQVVDDVTFNENALVCAPVE